jgi:hypothetical protein
MNIMEILSNGGWMLILTITMLTIKHYRIPGLILVTSKIVGIPISDRTLILLVVIAIVIELDYRYKCKK